MPTPYDDIIRLPHHVSQNHPQMPMLDRAAQFALFAALTGCEAVGGENSPTDRRKARTGRAASSILLSSRKIARE